MATATMLPSSPSTNSEEHALAWAHPVVRAWFLDKFGSATEPQIEGWPAIVRGEPTLISAPTGSGKTLAAFLVAIDRLVTEAIEGRLSPYTQVVYVSPLKALSNDVQKNLEAPLAEILQLALEQGYLVPQIRTGVRTGDTLPRERVAMLKTPPHILVTTPESLYLLLTSAKARENLRCVHTVIVDEIHAMADDKRGAHLALTLERLDALVTGENRLTPAAMLTGLSQPPQRIGLSATQNPIELVADFLTGVTDQRATTVQVGTRRTLDLGIEIPSSELSSVCDSKMWIEIFDRIADLCRAHKSTLVFVNTRRMVERLCGALAERLGTENVAAHHGSLSRALRLDAEQRLKAGEIQCLVATASLELGIDIGAVDLVIQLNSTRAVATAMQRVGRAGHWRGAIPKGRFFATTRDDLLEMAALVQAMRSGSLDRLEIPPQPRDILMQQMVAACAAEPWEEDALYSLVTRAYPYRNLTRAEFDELVTLLHTGIENSRGRYGAYLLRDGVAGHLHPRRGARMTAIGNGGAIPDTAIFQVVLQPEGVTIATLDEHYAIDSGPGDVIQLGNASWRILMVEKEGRVLVEDAHGAPPNVPFWAGEAPQRTDVLSDFVGVLRNEIRARTQGIHHERVVLEDPQVNDAAAWLMGECCISESAAQQLLQYIVSGCAVLGAVPTKQRIIAERFFDEGGGMQLILHAPFGGRINRAWGLALRKRFCRGFNYELQAAATDNGINICLAEQHSFPLSDVFHYLTDNTAKELLEQAAIASPIFKTRWRWAANRSLQLLRFSKGKRVAPQIQRTRGEDLLASVFPQAAACFETIVGDIEIPNHPLVREVMQDVLQEAMDLDGLLAVLRGIDDGSIECIAVDTPVPSQFSHELLNANQNAFLDDADLEERRARAVSLRRTIPDSVLGEAGRLDPRAILQARCEVWPDLRDEHELHDLLFGCIALPVALFAEQGSGPDGGNRQQGSANSEPASSGQQGSDGSEHADQLRAHREHAARHWPLFFQRLQSRGRAHAVQLGDALHWVATERLDHARLLAAIATPSTSRNKNPDAPSSTRPATPDSAQLSSASKVGPNHGELLAAHGEPSPSQSELLLSRSEAEESAFLAAPDQPSGTLPPANPTESDSKTPTTDEALRLLTQGYLQLLGPTTAHEIAALAGLVPRAIFQQLVAIEMQGLALRGIFEHEKTDEDAHLEWCERRILQRVHRLTLGALRKQVEAVPPATYMRWLLRWQHLAKDTQLSGEEGVLDALLQLEGFEAPAVEWERSLLPSRVRDYEPRFLDALCLSGAVGWGRISPHPAWAAGDGAAPRRVIPTNMAPITFYVRESADWLAAAMDSKCVEEAKLQAALSPEALAIRDTLQQRGACFTGDLQRLCTLTKPQVQTALWELATAGLASADGFDPLRAMMDPKRKPLVAEPVANGTKRGARATGGRWSLFDCEDTSQQTAPQKARIAETALESATKVLLQRYGVLFRDLIQREANAPKWRDLLRMLRRLEARGDVRGGRFVTGFSGEQYALPEAVESLRLHRASTSDDITAVAASDPVNLVGILIPGERTAAVAGRRIHLRHGAACDEQGNALDTVATPEGMRAPRRERRSTAPFGDAITVPPPPPSKAQGGLFA